jgi:hypothetical protein
MNKNLILASLLSLAALGALPFPAASVAVTSLAGDGEVIIAGTVISVSDQDGDGKNDTFVIQTGINDEGEIVYKIVSNETETAEMGIIALGDHVEIECKVNGGGDLRIKDVIKIGE